MVGKVKWKHKAREIKNSKKMIQSKVAVAEETEEQRTDFSMTTQN